MCISRLGDWLGKYGLAMAKQDLTEQEIRSQYIRPAIVAAGWNSAEIREGHHFTVGRMRITSHRRSIRPLLADQTT